MSEVIIFFYLVGTVFATIETITDSDFRWVEIFTIPLWPLGFVMDIITGR